MRRIRLTTHFLPLALVALALLLRAAIPAGWMPDSESGHWIRLCTTAGPTVAWLDHDGTPKEHPDGTAADQHCTFSTLGAPLTPPEAPEPTASEPRNHAETTQFPTPVRIGAGLAAPPPPQTGPPLFL